MTRRRERDKEGQMDISGRGVVESQCPCQHTLQPGLSSAKLQRVSSTQALALLVFLPGLHCAAVAAAAFKYRQLASSTMPTPCIQRAWLGCVGV